MKKLLLTIIIFLVILASVRAQTTISPVFSYQFSDYGKVINENVNYKFSEKHWFSDPTLLFGARLTQNISKYLTISYGISFAQKDQIAYHLPHYDWDVKNISYSYHIHQINLNYYLNKFHFSLGYFSELYSNIIYTEAFWGGNYIEIKGLDSSGEGFNLNIGYNFYNTFNLELFRNQSFDSSNNFFDQAVYKHIITFGLSLSYKVQLFDKFKLKFKKSQACPKF
jgi:hypothetical protein